MKEMYYIKWHEYNQLIYIAEGILKQYSFDNIYGIKRGGLIPAVHLSHLLSKPLTNNPISTTLIIDDIFDSGETIRSYLTSKIKYCLLSTSSEVLYSKRAEAKYWYVFPWEDGSKAFQDYQNYLQRYDTNK